jgi:hypothetical protein
MPLPTFKSKAEIPKGFEDEYEEIDGEWKPIDHSSKLSKALKEERERREAAEVTARKASKEAAESSAKAAAHAAGMTSEDLKKAYDKIEASIRAEYDPQLKEAEGLKLENRKLKLTDVVKGQFRALGALDNKLDDFWKLHGDEFDLTADGKPMVKSEPGKDVAKHVAGIMKGRGEWVKGTKASGGGAGGTQQVVTTPTGSGANGVMTFDDVLKNPAAAVAQANSV